jgi:glycosyltransferase involved in cell wall biosynthesis
MQRDCSDWRRNVLVPAGETLDLKAPKDLRAGLVSIGVPVYNGARYLRESLNSLLVQDYPAFEIIISDNASEDETEAICRDYAAKDERVRYYRSDINRGANWNWLRTYELARGEYFMWQAHDDWRDPRCLSLCVAALERNPRALMCYMATVPVDKDGRDISDVCQFESYAPTGASRRQRIKNLLRSNAFFGSYAMFRTPAIELTRMATFSGWGGDILLAADICLRSEVVAVAEPLFYYRWLGKTGAEMAAEQGFATSEPSWLGVAAELMDSVQRAPIGFFEKLAIDWTIAVELGVRNRTLVPAMRGEGFRGLRPALSRGEYRRAIRLGFAGIVSQSPLFVQRLKNSLRYRGTQLKRMLLPTAGEHR